MKRFFEVFALAWLVALPGCRKSKATPATPLQLLPHIQIDATRTDLLFSFLDADGHYHDVSKIEDVPEDRRKQVLVRDLSKNPDEIQADQYLFVANLVEGADGGYPYAVVSRYGFDRLVKQMSSSGELDSYDDADGGDRSGVVLYGTSWCGACAAARQFFTAHKIQFVDKDIEKDSKAQAELLRKARKAGASINGVPVIDFRGTLMLGFNQSRLEQLLKGS
jgi:glutaredoxin